MEPELLEPELLDLLKEAKDGAPPPRYGVADVVAAGRRRRRKRRAGWAITAVAAVLAAIGVPVIVARGPAPGPVVDGSTGDRWPLVFTFRGYQAGGFQVDDPSTADWGSDAALVHRPSAAPNSLAAGTLQVFHPGTDPSSHYLDQVRTPAATVSGRQAFFSDAHDELWWQYTDDAWAVLTAQDSAMSHAEMREVAEGFRVGTTRPVQIGFATARPPDGYVLVAAHSSPDRGSSGVTFMLTSVAAEAAARPDREADQSILGLRIDLARWTPSYPASSSCPSGAGSAAQTCYRRVGDSVLSATWQLSDTGPLTTALNSMALATVGVDGAFPASARLTG
jgi:hypothetical protein